MDLQLCKNHRIVEAMRGWKGPVETVQSIPLSFSGPCLVMFWMPPRMETPPTSLGNLCQCSVMLTLEKCFLMFRWNFLYFNLYSLPLLLWLGITKTSLSQSPLHSPIRYLFTLITSTLSFLFSMLSCSGSISVWQVFWGLNHLCGPLLDSCQYVHACLLLGIPELNPVLQMSH